MSFSMSPFPLRFGSRQGGGLPLVDQVAAIFAAHDDGGWWAADAAYQDTALTTPATAVDDPVRGLMDLTGNARHFVEETAYPVLKDGINGRLAAYSDGTKKLFRTSSTLLDGVGYAHVFVVCSHDSIGSGLKRAFSNRRGASAMHVLGVGQNASRYTTGGRTNFAGSYVNIRATHAVASENILHEGIFDHAGNVMTEVIDGSVTNILDPFQTAGTTTAGSHEMALFNNVSTEYMTGRIGEVLVFVTALTADEVNTVRNYLAQKWGVNNYTAFVPGIWSWFTNPRGVITSGTARAGTTTSGNTAIIGLPVAGIVTDQVQGPNDHNHPSFLTRVSDSKVIAFQCAHNGAAMNVAISTNANDVAAWGTASDISSQIGASTYTYPCPVQLEDITNDPIYLMYRRGSGSAGRPYMAVSTDGGATWGAGVNQWSSTSRPYWHLAKANGGRFDMLMTNGHPAESTTSLYHAYFDGSDWKNSDGTNVTGSLPFAVTDATLVYDGSSAEAWSWDLQWIDSTLVGVFQTSADTDSHRYRRCHWTGSAWSISGEICDAGGPLYAGQAYYAGGIALDPDDMDVVYCSRSVSAGLHQIWRYETADGGTTWTGEQLTNLSTPCFRPYIIGRALFYVTGIYTSYLEFRTHLRSISI